MKPTLPVFAVLLATFSTLAQPPQHAVEGAEVTLPYSELRRLLDASTPEAVRQPPPVAAALISARYEVDLSGDPPLVAATFVAENFTDNPLLVPLASATLPVLPDASAPALLREGRHLAAMLAGGERRTVAVRFPAFRRQGGDEELSAQFPIVSAATQTVLLRNIPAGAAVHVPGGHPAGTGPDGQEFALSGSMEEMALHVTLPGGETESRWRIESVCFVTPTDGGLAHESRVRTHLEEGDAAAVTLLLPANVRGLKVEGEHLETWRALRSAAGTHIELQIRWRTRRVLERLLTLRYEIPLAPLADEWPLVAPSQPDERSATALFVLAHPEDMNLAGEGLKENPGRLPAWVQERLGNSRFAAIAGSPDALLRATTLPRADTARSLIRKAQVETRVGAAGSRLTTATYEIEHRGGDVWSARLPEGGELLECSVNQLPVRPIQRDGALEIPLANGRQTTTLSISYTSKGNALDAVSGGLLLETPRVALFANRIDWMISLPSDFEIVGVETGAEILRVAPQESPPGAVWIRSGLVRDEPGAAEIFYRKQGIAQ